MDFVIDNSILERHIRTVLNTYYTDVFETSEYYNIRCNVCGDSKKDKYKKRGFILKNKTPLVYFCHNCGISTTAIKWLKEYYPTNYKNMMIDIMRNKNPGDDRQYDFKKKDCVTDRDEKQDTKHFEPLINFPDCVQYCENRKIPYEVYSKWRYATGGVFFGRIIITFLKPNGKIYYYQGRSFNNSKTGMKYLSRFGDHKNTIYNYYCVDPEKPVPVLEGPIDSAFVENSIAVTGLKLKGDILDKFPKIYFLLDNDESAFKKAHKLLKEKKYVFNWKKFLDTYKCKNVKDVNDFIINNTHGITKLTWDIIQPYFTNNISDKIYFPIKTKKENI